MQKFLRTLYIKGEVPASRQVPKSLASQLENLQYAKIIVLQRAGRGKKYVVQQPQDFEEWLLHNAEEVLYERKIEDNPWAESIANKKDSKKAKSDKEYTLVFLKGNCHAQINGKQVDVQALSNTWGCFGLPLKNLEVSKVCFVENYNGAFDRIATFLRAPYEQGYLFIHAYGRIGKKFLQKIKAEQVLFAPDYDYIGLDEYLKCKEILVQTQLYIPEYYETLYQKYSTSLQKESKKGQIPTTRVLQSKDPVIIRIREDLVRHRRFLEQQAIVL